MTAVKNFSENIRGQSILLCRNDETAAQEMFDLIDQNRDQLNEFLPWPDKIKNVQDQINYIKMTNESWKQKALFDYGIYNLANQKFVGNIGVHSIDWRNSRCELGYWLGHSFEGQGFASEAVGLVENECFKIGFHRIEIRCSTRNEKSAYVALRNRYKLEGILKNEIIENNIFRDTMIFAKLATEIY